MGTSLEGDGRPQGSKAATRLVDRYYTYMREQAIEEGLGCHAFHLALVAVALKNLFTACDDENEISDIRDYVFGLLKKISGDVPRIK